MADATPQVTADTSAATRYPAGVQHSSGPSHEDSTIVSNAANSNGGTSPNIEFISRTGNFVNKQIGEGWDVFTFHNSANDLLNKWKMSGLTNDLLSTLPSEWISQYGNDEEGLNNLLANSKQLIDTAAKMWNQSNMVGSTPSGWMHYQDIYQQNNQRSMQSNQGTYKEGYADHPDYTGEMGSNTDSTFWNEKVGNAVEDTALGLAYADPEVAVAIGAVGALGYMSYNAIKDVVQTAEDTAGSTWDKIKAVAGTPTTWDDIKNLFSW